MLKTSFNTKWSACSCLPPRISHQASLSPLLPLPHLKPFNLLLSILTQIRCRLTYLISPFPFPVSSPPHLIQLKKLMTDLRNGNRFSLQNRRTLDPSLRCRLLLSSKARLLYRQRRFFLLGNAKCGS